MSPSFPNSESPLPLSIEQDGSLRIGAAASIADIASSGMVRAHYPMLASACAQGESTLSIAGDLLQPPRCSYLRRGVPCLKNGGSGCPAHDGENHDLAILDGGPCWIVNASDAAIALVALDAEIRITGPGGSRAVAAADFFVIPRERMDRETVLVEGEHIHEVRLPAAAAGGLQRYTRLVEPGSTKAPIVSLAMARRADGEARLVLGGVSPRPYRIYTSVEEEAVSGGLDEDTIAGLAERALLDAEPLSRNGFKVELAASLLRDAIRDIDSA
ncbi:MAG: FAD-binding molybdopterin dehydrogenase [Gemmatimonadetes bacterium]|nr:FAD-binding molybdopterin dehydrogenase [Gemmatimonadota bacterium]